MKYTNSICETLSKFVVLQLIGVLGDNESLSRLDCFQVADAMCLDTAATLLPFQYQYNEMRLLSANTAAG